MVFSRGKPGADGDEDEDNIAAETGSKKTQGTELLAPEGQDEAMPGGVTEAASRNGVGSKLFNQKKGTSGPGRPGAVTAQPKDEKKVNVGAGGK